MVTYKAILHAIDVAEEDIKTAVAKIESIPGVKVLEATGKHILVQFETDIKVLANNPMLQRQFDIIRGDVRAEIEKIGGLTIKQCIAAEVNFVKRIYLFFKRLFTK